MPVRTNSAYMARIAVEIPRSLTDSGDYALIDIAYILSPYCLALWCGIARNINATHPCKMLYPRARNSICTWSPTPTHSLPCFES
ncbi:protein of unknown function [Methanoculleus bourgensis]|uniref:Uncharacterized protein n=1 Tax=Methanoculleus bourgensis TaxID=83986 RepID=A0A110BKG3_9EURY|nr:protein of unknown function [Methanoculleus bourgensis]